MNKDHIFISIPLYYTQLMYYYLFVPDILRAPTIS
jgi:hypothetical protein